MFSQTIFTVLPAFFLLALGAPAVEEAALEARSGDHYAVVYNGAGCTGSSLDVEINFGCGGTCHQVGGIASILLSQAGTGNPKPTAELYSDSNCENGITHAGIFSGQNDGCTNTAETANSFYLYFNC
ncbi:hypothetical protein V8E51_005403 [Hyaloscypha variabilis]